MKHLPRERYWRCTRIYLVIVLYDSWAPSVRTWGYRESWLIIPCVYPATDHTLNKNNKMALAYVYCDLVRRIYQIIMACIVKTIDIIWPFQWYGEQKTRWSQRGPKWIKYGSVTKEDQSFDTQPNLTIHLAGSTYSWEYLQG